MTLLKSFFCDLSALQCVESARDACRRSRRGHFRGNMQLMWWCTTARRRAASSNEIMTLAQLKFIREQIALQMHHFSSRNNPSSARAEQGNESTNEIKENFKGQSALYKSLKRCSVASFPTIWWIVHYILRMENSALHIHAYVIHCFPLLVCNVGIISLAKKWYVHKSKKLITCIRSNLMI